MLGLILGLGTFVSRPVHAEIQNDLIGFSPNHVFESAEAGEHIDVMSGNLTLTIPIGPRIKLSDNFSYGVTLYYNSKIWEHECPNGYGVNTPCPGTIPLDTTVGLGFSILPGRIYHHLDDKAYVFRLQLEDGSEHFFCDPSASGFATDTNAPQCVVQVLTPYTNDVSHIRVEHHYTADNPPKQGWKATMPNGRRIIFGKVLNTTTHEALATRIEGLTPSESVDYAYVDGTYKLTDITDSQGRVTHITYGLTSPYTASDIAIDVPAFAIQASVVPATTARYILRKSTSLVVYDPSDGVTTTRYPAWRISGVGTDSTPARRLPIRHSTARILIR